MRDGREDGEPVASVRCDESGQFEFHDVEPGEYFIKLELPLQIDEGPLVGLGPPEQPRVAVQNEDAVAFAEVVFGEGVSVRGRVVNHLGDPIERAVVGSESGMNNYMVRTDGKGEFVYRGLPSQTPFVLTVVEPMKYRDDNQVRYGYARRIEVDAIESGGLEDVGEVVFELMGKGEVRGEYLDTDGNRLSGTRVIKVLAEDGSLVDAIISTDGRISGELPSGTYRMLYNGEVVEESVFEVREGDITDVDLQVPESDE